MQRWNSLLSPSYHRKPHPTTIGDTATVIVTLTDVFYYHSCLSSTTRSRCLHHIWYGKPPLIPPKTIFSYVFLRSQMKPPNLLPLYFLSHLSLPLWYPAKHHWIWSKHDVFQFRSTSSFSASYCRHPHLTSIIKRNYFINNEAFRYDVFQAKSTISGDRAMISGDKSRVFASWSTIYSFISTNFSEIKWPNIKYLSTSTTVVALSLLWNIVTSSPSLYLWSSMKHH